MAIKSIPKIRMRRCCRRRLLGQLVPKRRNRTQLQGAKAALLPVTGDTKQHQSAAEAAGVHQHKSKTSTPPHHRQTIHHVELIIMYVLRSENSGGGGGSCERRKHRHQPPFVASTSIVRTYVCYYTHVHCVIIVPGILLYVRVFTC